MAEESQINNQQQTRLSLLKEFEAAPSIALFKQATLAAIRECSEATLERDRWAGGGVPFIKCGRSVRYRKIDILHWLEQNKSVNSTTETHKRSYK